MLISIWELFCKLICLSEILLMCNLFPHICRILLNNIRTYENISFRQVLIKVHMSHAKFFDFFSRVFIPIKELCFFQSHHDLQNSHIRKNFLAVSESRSKSILYSSCSSSDPMSVLTFNGNFTNHLPEMYAEKALKFVFPYFCLLNLTWPLCVSERMTWFSCWNTVCLSRASCANTTLFQALSLTTVPPSRR